MRADRLKKPIKANLTYSGGRIEFISIFTQYKSTMRKNLFKANKKGQAISLSSLPTIVLVVVFAILIGAIGLVVLINFKTSVPSGSQTAAFNDTIDAGVSTISNIFSLMPLVGTIVVLAIIIALLVVAFFWARGRGFGGGGM